MQNGQLAAVSALFDSPQAHALALGVLLQAFTDTIAKGVIEWQLAHVAGDTDGFDSSNHGESFSGGSNTRGWLLRGTARAGLQFAAGQHLDLVGTALGDDFVPLADSNMRNTQCLCRSSDAAEMFNHNFLVHVLTVKH